MDQTSLTCRCGACRLTLTGPQIMAVTCMCASCAKAAERLAALPGAEDIRDARGGTDYVMYRKDRVAVTEGAEHLAAMRLGPQAKTRRVVATCCATPMFLEFQGGHWLSLYAGLWPAADRPAMEMRTMVRDSQTALPDDIPNLQSHNLRFMARLMGAWAAMGFRAPKLDYLTRELTDA